MKKSLILTALLPVLAISDAATDINSVIEKVLKSIEKHKLTQIPKECLLLLPQEKEDKIIIDIREKHDENCQGDENTAPRLFTYEVDKKTGEMRTDDPIWTGEYRKID